MVVAGLLHDTVEDAGFSIQQIAQLYGNEVAAIVEGCSEPDKSLSWRELKYHTIEYLRNAPFEVRMVTCADKLDNISAIARDFKQHGDELWSRFNAGKERQRWYYHELLESLSKGDIASSLLFKEFEERVEEVFDTKNPWGEEPDLSEYHYFEKDDAIFRRKENSGQMSISDVLTSEGWKPYTGDRLKPVYFGNRISEKDAMSARFELAKDSPYAMDGDELVEILRANGLKLLDL